MDFRIEEIPAAMLVGYRRVGFGGEPHRLSLYGDDVESTHPYHSDFPGLLAFIDYFETPTNVDIGFVSVEPKSQGAGNGRAILQKLYDATGDKRIYWGKLMDDSMVHLKKEFRDIYPSRTAAAPEVMYHISPPFNRNSILQHGLDFSKSDPRGRLEGHDANWPGGNYLFPSYNAADMSSEDDIYEVNVAGLNVLPDPYEGLKNDTWYTPDPIPAERIKLVRPSALPEDFSPWWERSANIFDPIQSNLDQKVFTGINPKPTTLNFIHSHLKRVLQREFGFDALQYIDLYLTGSLTTYQWDETSDCDVSVFVQWDKWPDETSAKDIRKKLVLVMIDKCDGVFLPGTQHPLQHFVVPPDTMPEDLYKPGLRSAYSFQDHSWVVPPEKERVHDVSKELPILYHRAQDMASKMEIALDYDTYFAKDLWHQIHAKRTLDQRHGLGDFSEGNIVYKYLLHNGYFDRIRSELGEYIAKVAMPMNQDWISSLTWQWFPYGHDDLPSAEMKAFDQTGKMAGTISVGYGEDYGGFYIENIWVDPEYRRQGLATVLRQRAEKSLGDKINHDVDHLSDDGSQWMKAVGKEAADSMRWDSLDGIPAGGVAGETGDSGKWNLDTETQPAVDQMDNSLKVIYDFDRDSIILGTRAQASELPNAQMVGEYDGGNITLYDLKNHWLNANYFKKLWQHSFPDRPFRNLYLESGRQHEHIHSATLREHGTSTQESEHAQAGVGLPEGGSQDGQEAPQGSELLPLSWKTAEQYGSFDWPSVDEIKQIGQEAVEETGQAHPGWYPHAEGALDAARGAAINRHVGMFGSGGTEDPFELAAHLIWRIQDTQAAIDGNKRAGAATGLGWLAQHGIEVNLPEDDSFFQVVDSASQMEPEAGAQAIAEYLRSYAEKPAYPEEWTDE